MIDLPADPAFLQSPNRDESWMREAMAEARAALALGEVPIGCVIVHVPTGRIVGRGHNLRLTAHDPTGHAEILALREAGAAMQDWRLLDCVLYVTLEPCPMCAGAIVNARLPRLVYACDDPKAGAVKSLFNLCSDERLNHRLQITSGLLADECATLLRGFFKSQRASGKK